MKNHFPTWGATSPIGMADGAYDIFGLSLAMSGT